MVLAAEQRGMNSPHPPEKELMEVEGIGKKRANAIREVLTKGYLKGEK